MLVLAVCLVVECWVEITISVKNRDVAERVTRHVRQRNKNLQTVE